MRNLSPFTFVKGLKDILSGKPGELPDRFKNNETLKLLFKRRSIRKFKTTPIPDDAFNIILEAARIAPSTVNLQTWSFGVYDSKQWKETFNSAIPFNAVRAVVILGDMHRDHTILTDFPHKPLVEYTLCVINASIASFAMNMAAESLGIGSVMLSETGKSGFYDGLYLKEKLGLPDSIFPIMTMVFGYPAEKPMAMPPRFPMKEVTFTGKYKGPDRKITDNWLKQMQAGYRAMFVIQSFKDKLNHYLKKSDEAEKGLHKMIFHRKEEFKKKIK